MEEIPTEEFIRKWNDAQPFIIEPTQIEGIYRNLDIDAVVFKYLTSTNEDEFWNILDSNIKETEWKLVAETSGSKDYERQFSKGDKSPNRPDMATFSSAEKMRIEYVSNRQMVIVGYVQADSSEKETSYEATDEAKWAQKEIWPRFDKVKNEH
jgi:hypothetical protein